MPAALSSASILLSVPVSIASRATVRLFLVPRVRPPVLGLGIYFLYFVYFSLLALALSCHMAYVGTNLGANEGTDYWHGQHYLPDERADDRVDRVVDDVAAP
jgi:hypothetical protein